MLDHLLAPCAETIMPSSSARETRIDRCVITSGQGALPLPGDESIAEFRDVVSRAAVRVRLPRHHPDPPNVIREFA
ncbi:hypothetical protein ACFVIM_15040 [Streptomyces sp. NPDC057638]|uniref:hypothetical protein n=1 Tax=Streptomyces sp. NPDC057638 TaxID=3346190 RepID=UPI0036995668